MKIITLEQMKAAMPGIRLLEELEAGFMAYSERRAEVPPVGELRFDDPPGEVHIKYGYLRGDEFYVIKIASGFYDNPKRGLPSGNGLMLLFSQKTGELEAALLDQGWLTDVRTAAAGAIAARYLAPQPVTRIGIIGTGVQARLQLRWLLEVTPCREVTVWGRTPERADEYAAEIKRAGYAVEVAGDAREVPRACNLIVTTTASAAPVLFAADVRPGTHISAVGADSPRKQELEAALFSKADVVVVDSVSQCVEHGDLAHAVRAGSIRRTDVRELGAVISGQAPGRTRQEEITIADLTGVAVQDVQIAKAVYRACQ
jgi:ornithine cyclodeaminase